MAHFSCHNRVSYSPDFAAYLSCLSPFGPSPPSPLPVLLHQAGDQAITPSCFPCYNNHYSEAASDIFPVDIISSTLNAGGADSVSAGTTELPTPEGSGMSSTGSIGENKITSASSSSVDPRSQSALISKTQQYYSTQKRKDRQTCLSGSANSKDIVKSRKPKKRGGAPEEAEEQKAPSESPVAGYVHVRARPGEATDSHSLAERVRREKIREKMRTLQELVPGCDKMVGKAQLLEEIIHYVQSLQNQVQFLSTKLASMDPIFHDVNGLGFLDYLILQEELENISLGLPVVLGTGQTRPMAPSADAANEDPVHDASVLASLLHEEGPPSSCNLPQVCHGGCTVWEPRSNA